MGGILSTNNVAPQNPDSKLIKSRLEAHRRKAREGIDSMLKALEAKQRDLHDDDDDPLHPSRPYGLDEGMEGIRRHIWDLIFAHVNDLDTIVILHEVCMMFRDMLDMKYKAIRLPEVIVKCLQRKITFWKHAPASTIDRSNWFKTLESLRYISKTTKNSVEIQFDRDMLVQGSREREDEAGIFCNGRGRGLHSNLDLLGFPALNFGDCKTEQWKIPTLMFGARDAEQARLTRTLEILENDEASVDNFSVRALVLDESRQRGVRFDLRERDLHDDFLKCLEKIGHKITSFRYRSLQQNIVDSYDNLKEWLPHMPNLEELMLDPKTQSLQNLRYDPFVDPFVTCPKLKRFALGCSYRDVDTTYRQWHRFDRIEFDYRYIAEILRANPTIEEVLLSRIPTSAEEMDMLNEALLCLRLKKLYIASALFPAPFFEYTFQDEWALCLTHFILVMDTDRPYPFEKNQSESDKVFAFLSKFKNLKVLGIMLEGIRDTGGYLHLPKLESVYLKVFSDFMSLDFLKHAKDLKWLYLDLRGCLKSINQYDPQPVRALSRYV